MFASLFRSGILLASAILWMAGLRLFVGAELTFQRKLMWSVCLVVAGGLIGLLLPAGQVWNKFLILFAFLPLLGVADVVLLRSRRTLSFWIRACGFELGTVFGMAGVTRLLCDRIGVGALLGAS